MKKILSILVLNILLITSTFTATTHAADDLDWNDIEISYEYDSSDEELEVKIFLEDVNNRPSEDYEVEIEVDNRDYEEEMNYSSSRDEFYVNFEFENVDSNDFQDYRDIEIVIRDEDNDRVFDGDIRLSNIVYENDDSFDWEDDFEVSYEYDSSRDRLNIKFVLEDIDITPEESYRVYLEADNSDYDERMYYSSSNDELSAHFYISDVESNEVDDYYDLEVEVKDDSGNTVFEDDMDLLDFAHNSGSSSSEENWDDLEATIWYEASKNKIHVNLKLRNVSDAAERKANSDDYIANVNLAWKSYSLVFRYSSIDDSLNAYKWITVLSASRVKTSYSTKISIHDGSRNVYDDTITIKTDKNAITWGSTQSSTSSSSNTTSSAQTTSNAQIFAYKYIFRVEAKYSWTTQRIQTLNSMVSALKWARYSYSNTAYIDGIIETIEERITSYSSSGTTNPNTQNNSSNSNNSNGNNTNSSRTYTQPWSTKSDGKGWTYRTYWGYNH